MWNDRCNNKINSIIAGHNDISPCSYSSKWNVEINVVLKMGIRTSPWLHLFRGHCVNFQCWTVNTLSDRFPSLSSHYPSQNTLYLQLQSIYRLQWTGFGVHMLRVLLNHPDFTSPAGASWKACQILDKHDSSASYTVWHQMYSITVV